MLNDRLYGRVAGVAIPRCSIHCASRNEDHFSAPSHYARHQTSQLQGDHALMELNSGGNPLTSTKLAWSTSRVAACGLFGEVPKIAAVALLPSCAWTPASCLGVTSMSIIRYPGPALSAPPPSLGGHAMFRYPPRDERQAVAGPAGGGDAIRSRQSVDAQSLGVVSSGAG